MRTTRVRPKNSMTLDSEQPALDDLVPDGRAKFCNRRGDDPRATARGARDGCRENEYVDVSLAIIHILCGSSVRGMVPVRDHPGRDPASGEGGRTVARGYNELESFSAGTTTRREVETLVVIDRRLFTGCCQSVRKGSPSHRRTGRGQGPQDTAHRQAPPDLCSQGLPSSRQRLADPQDVAGTRQRCPQPRIVLRVSDPQDHVEPDRRRPIGDAPRLDVDIERRGFDAAKQIVRERVVPAHR